MDSVGSAFERIAAAHPSNVAIASLARSITYAELEEMSRKVARSLLDRGHAPGKSTALISTGIDYIVGYFGIVRAGNRAVPIEARFRGDQLRKILASTDVTLAVVDPAGEETMASVGDLALPRTDVASLLAGAAGGALPVVAPETELCVLFSSGSTGMPKGVVLTHEAGIGRAQLMARVFGPGKRHLVFTPLAYAYGLIDGTLCPLLHGGQTILLGSYNPGRFKEVAAHFVPQVVLGVPFLYRHLGAMALDLLADLPSRKTCLYITTGEPLPRAVQQAFQDRYGVPIRQSYGLSEISGIAADLHDAEPRASRVGKLIPGVQIRFVEEKAPGQFVDAPVGGAGEVWVRRSHRFMKGYVSGTETLEGRMAEDCYRTGDIGRVDEDGYLELFGRNDDFVNIAGVRVHPAEVENLLLSVPGVLEAAFVCERDADTGEQATRAYVVLDAAANVSVDDLVAKVRAELPPSRWPQRMEVSAGLPRTDTGKLVRRLLVARMDERLIANASVRIEAGGRSHAGQLVDVSRNGCMMRSPEAISKGEIVTVSIAVPDGATLTGVCRSTTPAPQGGHNVGVEFTTSDRHSIERFVERRRI
jgi:long-chain acyl-CoA synthetase